jgi:hypothetical protein
MTINVNWTDAELEAAVTAWQRDHLHSRRWSEFAAAINAAIAPREPTEKNHSRSEPYRQGYRAARKDAIEWLHSRARSMNDPHARDVLNSAAFNMGVEFAMLKAAGEKETTG